MTETPWRSAPVLAGPSSSILPAIRQNEIGLCLWWRTLCPLLRQALHAVLSEAPFCLTAEGEPKEAAASLEQIMPEKARCLRPDIDRLTTMFADVAGTSTVRLRVERTEDQPCPRLHVDAVHLRLLCTYAGRGTEWQDSLGVVRRMPLGHVGLFKGTLWPVDGPRVPHRSPAIADLPPGRRGRLLLCIDLPELN